MKRNYLNNRFVEIKTRMCQIAANRSKTYLYGTLNEFVNDHMHV